MMRYRSLIPAVLFAAPFVASATVPAPDLPPPQPSLMQMNKHPASKTKLPKFKQADKNHDGKIEWQEARVEGVSKKLFKREDFNSNGTLDKSEWALVRMDMNNPPPAAGRAAVRA